MTDKQKLELRQSVIRSRLAELGATEGTPEGQAEIDTMAVEYGSNEARIRAFMVADDAPVETTTATKESKERAELYTQGESWRPGPCPGQRKIRCPGRRDGRASGGARTWRQRESHIRQLSPETYAVTPAPTNAQETQQADNPLRVPACLARLSWPSICPR